MRISHKNHKVVYPFTGEKITIDKPIAPLLQALWDLGIETAESCIARNIKLRKDRAAIIRALGPESLQEYGIDPEDPEEEEDPIPEVWVAFRHTEGIEYFYHIMVGVGDGGFRRRVEAGEAIEGGWRFDVHQDGRVNLKFYVSVYFPISDFDTVIGALQKTIVRRDRRRRRDGDEGDEKALALMLNAIEERFPGAMQQWVDERAGR